MGICGFDIFFCFKIGLRGGQSRSFYPLEAGYLSEGASYQKWMSTLTENTIYVGNQRLLATRGVIFLDDIALLSCYSIRIAILIPSCNCCHSTVESYSCGEFRLLTRVGA